jgi:integrase
LGSSTVEHVCRLLRRVLSVALDDGLIGANPAVRLQIAVPRRRALRILTATEVRALAEAIEPRYRALVLTMAFTGVRVGEATALRIGDIDLAKGQLRVAESASEVQGKRVVKATKTGRIRTITLPPFLVEELDDHLRLFAPTDHVPLAFTRSDGGPILVANFRRRVFYPACHRAGFEPVHLHALRHTAAALAAEAGAHPKVVQEMLGHASIRTTLDVYGDLFPTLNERTSAALDAMWRGLVPSSAKGATRLGAPLEGTSLSTNDE